MKKIGDALEELPKLKQELVDACEAYWKVRRTSWEDAQNYKSGMMKTAKMRMYRAMKDLWGDIKDFYGDYEDE